MSIPVGIRSPNGMPAFIPVLPSGSWFTSAGRVSTVTRSRDCRRGGATTIVIRRRWGGACGWPRRTAWMRSSTASSGAAENGYFKTRSIWGFSARSEGRQFPFAVMWANRMPRRVLPVRRADLPVIERRAAGAVRCRGFRRIGQISGRAIFLARKLFTCRRAAVFFDIRFHVLRARIGAGWGGAGDRGRARLAGEEWIWRLLSGGDRAELRDFTERA